MNRMKEMAQNSKLVHEVAEGCENLVREFLYCPENNFRNGYLNACAQRAFKKAYSNDLAFVLLDPLVKGNYDGAIIAAFKCLDQHLQKLLNLTPSEYGEALINKAFSPQAGALKLQTHGNEQRGLRDLAIGANALFRNAVWRIKQSLIPIPALSEALASDTQVNPYPAAAK
jgi:Protein of unknown function (Hypoth_ymh)